MGLAILRVGKVWFFVRIRARAGGGCSEIPLITRRMCQLSCGRRKTAVIGLSWRIWLSEASVKPEAIDRGA